MKTYEEMSQSLFHRREQYFKRRKRRIRMLIRHGIPAVCVVIVFVLGFSLLKTAHPTYFHNFSTPLSPSHTTSPLLDSSSDRPLSNPESSSSAGLVDPTSHSSNKSDVTSVGQEEVNREDATIQQASSSIDQSSHETDSVKHQFTYSSLTDFEDWLRVTYADKLNGKEDVPETSGTNSSTPSIPNESASLSESVDKYPGFPNDPMYAPTPSTLPPSYEADANTSSNGTSHEQRFLDDAWEDFFADGVVLAPQIMDGNDQFRLNEIILNDIGLKYNYRYIAASNEASKYPYQLQVVIAEDDSWIEQELNQAVKSGAYQILTNGSLRFYAVKTGGSRNAYTIYWKQHGSYHVAYLYDVPSCLTTLPDLLPLIYVEFL